MLEAGNSPSTGYCEEAKGPSKRKLGHWRHTFERGMKTSVPPLLPLFAFWPPGGKWLCFSKFTYNGNCLTASQEQHGPQTGTSEAESKLTYLEPEPTE